MCKVIITTLQNVYKGLDTPSFVSCLVSCVVPGVFSKLILFVFNEFSLKLSTFKMEVALVRHICMVIGLIIKSVVYL